MNFSIFLLNAYYKNTHRLLNSPATPFRIHFHAAGRWEKRRPLPVNNP